MSTSGYQATSQPLAPSENIQSNATEPVPSAGTSQFELVGSGTAIERLRLQVRRIGPHFRTVLISGEPGCGKELVARALHNASPGAAEPFVICHAATLDDSMATSLAAREEAETEDRIARLLKMAHRGTLFLDGIHAMPPVTQTHLLRVLRRHEWAQEGLAAPQRMGVRLVASSSHDLQALVAAGRFRQELYHLIATLEITVPPLRERMEDLPELVRCFLQRFSRLYSKSVDRIAEDAMEQLTLHHWPGNVRELESTLRNSVLLSEGETIQKHDLPEFQAPDVAVACNEIPGGKIRLQDVVESHVLHVLKVCAGNKLRTAEVLGISRSTLYRMLEACTQGNAAR